jgi:hypothetical protein
LDAADAVAVRVSEEPEILSPLVGVVTATVGAVVFTGSWDTLYVCPAMVIVPVCAVVPE